jgi:hypothetical protein
MATLRGMQQPELSKKLYKLIKSENHAIQAYETAGRERISIASQLSDWGEGTTDETISDISDKLGVILSEIGEQEDLFAQNLEDYRGVLKTIRNMEGSVQPSRDQKQKTVDEIAKLKHKEPESTKIPVLEQQLVREEAQNLVAEAQLTNIVRLLTLFHISAENIKSQFSHWQPQTRQKLKEAYDIHFAAVIERAEKQIVLARHGRRLLNLLDDTPVVPGDTRPGFENAAQARQILHDAEEDLRDWQANLEPVQYQSQGMGSNLMPAEAGAGVVNGDTIVSESHAKPASEIAEGEHLAAATGNETEKQASGETSTVAA